MRYFKQRKQVIDHWEFNEDIVVVGIYYESILDIDLPNGQKRGEAFKLKGKSTFEFKDGKITRIEDES
jgi:hypothetical protein